MKNILENIKLTITMGIIGVLLLYIATTVFMPELTIKIFQFKPYVVVTESMEPEINVNDVVIATRFNIDDAEVGDIITFYADIDFNGTKEIVTHYIYSIDDSGDEAIIRTHRYFAEGEDVIPDTWLIPSSDVIGSYGFKISNLGLAVGFFKSIYGIAVVLINVVLIGALTFINKRGKRNDVVKQQELETINTQNNVKQV